MDKFCFFAIGGLTTLIGVIVLAFLDYRVKANRKNITLEKNDKQQQQRIGELEKKNGSEQKQINELKESNSLLLRNLDKCLEEIRKLKEKQ